MVALGRVVGALLDRSTSTESGTARLIHHRRDASVVDYRLHWRSIDVWRWQSAQQWSLSDGVGIYSKSREGVVAGPFDIRRGWPAWQLQLVFPLRAHVWGRLGDDYYFDEALGEREFVRVRMNGTEDDRAGSLLVDPSTGYIHEAEYDGDRLQLLDLEPSPQQDVLFTV